MPGRTSSNAIPSASGYTATIREFYSDEKHALLESLNSERVRLDSVWNMTAAFGALATPDMEPVLKSILSDSNRDRDHLMFTDFVLRVLREGGPLPNLSELLLEIVRDDTRWPRVNCAALDAFIHNCSDIEDKTSKLKALLADIHTGTLSDTNNELLGTLLAQLYPHDLPPSEVWGLPFRNRRPPVLWKILSVLADSPCWEILRRAGRRTP